MSRDYVLRSSTPGVYWPGLLPYRGERSPRGYRTREAAAQRARIVLAHYAAHYGSHGPDLTVVERRAVSK